jgi:hypothetical protein
MMKPIVNCDSTEGQQSMPRTQACYSPHAQFEFGA